MKYMSKKMLYRFIIFCILLVFSLILFFVRNGVEIWDDYQYNRLAPTDLSQVMIDGDRLGDIVIRNRGLHMEEDGVARTVEKTGTIIMLETRDVNRVLISSQLMFGETLTQQSLEDQLTRSLGNYFVYEYKTYTYIDPENNIAFKIRDDYKNNEFVFSLHQYDTFINYGTRSSLISNEWDDFSRNSFLYILLSALIAPLTIFLLDFITLTTALLIAPTLTPLVCVLIPSTRSSSRLKNIGIILFYVVYFILGILLVLISLTAF